MKIIIFLIITAILAVGYAILNPILSSDIQTMGIWVTLVAIAPVLLALAAWISQRGNLKNFFIDYLTIKNTDWRNVVKYVIATAVLLPVLMVCLVAILGNLCGMEYFGAVITTFTHSISGIYTITSDSVGSMLGFLLIFIVLLATVGSISGIFNHLLEEMAWRGFLVKYLNCNESVKPLVIAVIWTSWIFALNHEALTIANCTAMFAANVALSYYLVSIARHTGSVWACGMVRGITSMCIMLPFLSPNPTTGYTVVSIISIISLMLISNSLVTRK